MTYMKLFIFLFFCLQYSWAQVNFTPSWVVGFNQERVVDDFVLAPYDIIFDSTRGAVLPRMYRSPVFFRPSANQKFDVTGFNQLQISGSAQYSLAELKELVSHIHKRHGIPCDKIYILDFREEPHAFINNAAVSWFYGPLNVQQNKSSDDVIESEHIRVEQVKAFSRVFIHTVGKSDNGMPSLKTVGIYPVEGVMSELEAVQGLGANYVRFPVTDHFRPEERDVDDFVEFVKRLPKGAWLHFKCRGGKGRTTTFMTLFDIIQNPMVTLDQILARQKAIGGTNLVGSKSLPAAKKWKQRLSADRINLIRVFYHYRHAKDGWDQMTFSDWVKKHAQYLGYLGDSSFNSE
jgi:protein-tyrosine phosphatase